MSPSTEQRENREFASEIKFVITPRTAQQLRGWASAHLIPDPHCSDERGDGYDIDSLYFDTERFDVFHKRGSYGRSKYRIRRYGCGNLIFLERKLKTRGLVSKRRTEMLLSDLSRFSNCPPMEEGESSWFERRLAARQLKPICQIGYRRTARVLMTRNGAIRLTIDEDLRARLVEDLEFAPRAEGSVILNEHAILELKYRLEMPVIFKLLIEEFALNARCFSKYRQTVTELGVVKEMAQDSPADNSNYSYA
jgi:hypothetical protein